MKTATAGELTRSSLWRPAEKSSEAQEALAAFAADGYTPRPKSGYRYYFLPLGELPWPSFSDPSWHMNDVQEFFVEHYRLDPQRYPSQDILYACTKSFGEIVIVPEAFLKAADVPRDT